MSDYFNGGWGNFGGGRGSDASRVANVWKGSIASYIPEGSASLRIRDDTDSSTVFLMESYDVSGFTNLSVCFSFKARKMENSEDFFLEYSSDGQNYDVRVKAWVIRRGSEFENNEYYYETIDFNAILRTDAYNLTQNAKICFVCDGSGNGDHIFIVEVKFEG
jgi:hypothetical protein